MNKNEIEKAAEAGADKWVFETNGHTWSNNNNEAGDNFGSYKSGFIAGATSPEAKSYWEQQGGEEWQKCPKCDGQGTVSKPPYIPGDVNVWTSTSMSHACDICEGKRIIMKHQSPTPSTNVKERMFTKDEVMDMVIQAEIINQEKDFQKRVELRKEWVKSNLGIDI